MTRDGFDHRIKERLKLSEDPRETQIDAAWSLYKALQEEYERLWSQRHDAEQQRDEARKDASRAWARVVLLEGRAKVAAMALEGTL